jgi:hypothetical protein
MLKRRKNMDDLVVRAARAIEETYKPSVVGDEIYLYNNKGAIKGCYSLDEHARRLKRTIYSLLSLNSDAKPNKEKLKSLGIDFSLNDGDKRRICRNIHKQLQQP